MENQGPRLDDILEMLRRRKWHIILTFAGLFPLVVAITLLLPPVFTSSATILIEEPDVPRELVLSTVTSYADQRLQTISQRVLATQNLLEIMQKYNLYPEKRASLPSNVVAEDMRKDVAMELISAQVLDPRSGRATKANIAFKLSFSHRSPQVTQRIASELVTLYLNENLRERKEKATETTAFLISLSRHLEENIAALEKQIADLKAQNADSLPENLRYNMDVIARAEDQLRDLERQERALQDRQVYLRATLSQINPHLAAGAPQVQSPEGRLAQLRLALAAASQSYGPNHPTVLRLSREVEALEKQLGPGAGKQAQPDNPAYIQLQADLYATGSELKGIAAMRQSLKERVAVSERRIAQVPAVEREYQRLTRAHEVAVAEYQAIRSKQVTAEMGEALETERKAERFSLVEPPMLPDRPTKPNRLIIIGVGFVLTLGAGFGIALLAELLDGRVYTARQLAAITGVMPLEIIPLIRTRTDVIRARRLRLAGAGGGSLLLIGLIAFLHFQVMPVDEVWAKVLQRIHQSALTAGL
jgi:polysaccharide chain length determinant protein (PEP-CTERM system associated)